MLFITTSTLCRMSLGLNFSHNIVNEVNCFGKGFRVPGSTAYISPRVKSLGHPSEVGEMTTPCFSLGGNRTLRAELLVYVGTAPSDLLNLPLLVLKCLPHETEHGCLGP